MSRDNGGGGEGGRIYRNNYNGHMDQKMGGQKQRREVGMARVVGRGARKRQKTVLEQQ